MRSRSAFACWCIVCAGVPMGLALLGCSPEVRTRLMHFFFEYPAPVAPPPDRAETKAAAPQAPQPAPVEWQSPAGFVSVHPPFLARHCDQCHEPGAGQAIRQDLDAACRRCHETHWAYHRFTHGPVAAGACRLCHTMHYSRQRALLVAPQAELCTACHPAQVDDAALTTYHRRIESVACTTCHEAHFAATASLLKPEALRNVNQTAAEPRPGGREGRASWR